jgi:hypothetical protein
VDVDRAVLLTTDAPRSRGQLEREVDFARASIPPSDRPSLSSSSSERTRVLVTAFGRFEGHATNASASIACDLLGARATFAPAHEGDAPDDPVHHVQTIRGVVALPRAGEIDLHVMVLPVMWDLAPLLALFAAAHVRPHAIVMNGVGAAEQAIGIEAEASNRASLRDDAGRLRPRGDEGPVRILADVDEHRRTLPFDAVAVRNAARIAWSRHASTMERGRRFDAVARDVEVMPGRDENAYLCNQLAYLVDRALAFPTRTLRLLRTTDDRGVDRRIDRGIDVSLPPSLRDIPRAFVHWPSTLVGAHVSAGADLLRAMLDAMLGARTE